MRILDVLKASPTPVSARRLADYTRRQIEGVYEELVMLEAQGKARVVLHYHNGQVMGAAWAPGLQKETA